MLFIGGKDKLKRAFNPILEMQGTYLIRENG